MTPCLVCWDRNVQHLTESGVLTLCKRQVLGSNLYDAPVYLTPTLFAECGVCFYGVPRVGSECPPGRCAYGECGGSPWPGCGGCCGCRGGCQVQYEGAQLRKQMVAS